MTPLTALVLLSLSAPTFTHVQHSNSYNVLNCKQVWVQECVRSPQDRYRNWYAPTMHSGKEQLAIMRRGKHICEFTDKGPCKGAVKLNPRRVVMDYKEGQYE